MYELLIKLGLSDKEASVYLAALELGEATVQNIAKKSGVKRVTTYVILERLLKLGLVSTVEHGKVAKFIAEDPGELANLLEEQRQELEQKKAYLNDAMTQLKAIYNTNQAKPVVRYFEGGDGLEALDRYGKDQLEPGSEVIAISPLDLIEQYFPKRRSEAVNDRIQKRIYSRAIYTHANGPIPDDVNESQLRKALFIPRDQLPIDATIQVYSNWGVKIFNYDPSNFFGILIQSPAIARNMQQLLELAWKGAEQENK